MSNFDLFKEFDFIVKPILTLSQDKCVSTLITIGEFNLLFDCGWDEKFSKKIKERYEKNIKNIKLDAIFISNNYINYFGALPLIKSFPQNLDTKVFATTPIAKLGIYVMIDAFISYLESDENALSYFEFSQETINEVFYKINDINYLQPIILNTKENVENNIQNNNSLTSIALPSGSSMGGTAWTCSYHLINFVYVSDFAIEPKIISDPFPYKKIKKINYLITDNKFQNEIPVIRKIIEEDFDKKIKECLDNKKHIFIPVDNINSLLEILVKFEKYANRDKENFTQNRIDKNEYKILVCSNCSNEIVEGVKSLTEFLGHKMSQQCNLITDKIFDFEDVQCIKNMEEFNEEYNDESKNKMSYIILATFENLNLGMGYNLIPILLTDKNIVLINIFKEFDLFSVFGDIIKQVKTLKTSEINYKEKKVLERKKPEEKDESTENKNMKIEENIQKNNIDNKDNDENNIENSCENENEKIMDSNKKDKILKIKKIGKKKKTKIIINKKLFNTQVNNEYLSFNFNNKIRYTDYGIEFSKGELKMMRKNNEPINMTYDSNLFNKDKKEIKLEITQFDVPIKLEIKNIKIDIKCEIYFYPLINKIDFMSKKLILEEINPKDGIILLGNNNQLTDSLNNKNILCFNLTKISVDEYQKYEKKIKNNIIEFNYTSEDLNKGIKFKNDKFNQNIYSFDSFLLSIKTKRDKLIDISTTDNKYAKIGDKNNEKLKVINTETLDNIILTQNDLNLINIKHQLESDTDLKFILYDKKLRTLDKSIEIYIEDGNLVLNGEFGEQYFKIKSKINDIYFNYYNNL